jgi:heptosyltransferase I
MTQSTTQSTPEGSYTGSPRLLIIKTSSMGDVIHTLPAISDLRRAFPNAQIDWLVESQFAEIPRQHPGVSQVIEIEWRSWIKSRNLKALLRALTRLHKRPYDHVIDAQGLFKSGVMSLFTSGHRHGFSRTSLREPIARLFYQSGHVVPRTQHAVERTRQLFAKALGYRYEAEPVDYGLTLAHSTPIPPKTLLFLANTTWPTKHWPASCWTELIRLATQAGYTVHLTSGSPTEWAYIEALSQGLEPVQRHPRQSITAVMQLISTVQAVVTVDTGFGHLAAALNKPVIALFGPTDPAKSKPYSPYTHAFSANPTEYACAPCLKRTCHHPQFPQFGYPPCFNSYTPKDIWDALRPHLNSQNSL